MDIDWSKAPEGFPLWIEELGDKLIGDDWHRDDGDRYVDQKGQYWSKRYEGMSYIVHRKPEDPATWNGEGPPPVGTVCEVLWSSTTGKYVTVHVVGHDGDLAVYRFVTGERKGEYQAAREYGSYARPVFRPLRTPEQIAAEERTAGIQQLLEDLKKVRGNGFCSHAEDLYDMGYRKQVQP